MVAQRGKLSSLISEPDRINPVRPSISLMMRSDQACRWPHSLRRTWCDQMLRLRLPRPQ